MSLLKKMGAAVGVGAAGVVVVLEGTEYAWGDTVRGTVRVTGGTTDQNASEIKVSVQEHWVTRDSDGDRQDSYEQHNTVVIANQVTLATGSSQEWPFEVQIPEGATPNHDWAIAAEVGIVRGTDPHAETEIKIGFPAEFNKVAAALCEVAEFKLTVAGAVNGGIDFDFRPPQELKKSLDGVRLILRREGGDVVGIFEINPQEKSLGDFLKSLAKKDRVRHDVRFTAAELAGTEASHVPQVVVSRLRALLQPYLG